jgi:hypothetical protein
MSSDQTPDQPAHTTELKGDKTTLGSFFSNISTPGVKNIEAAYSRAGASNHHTPGSASKLGSQDQQGASEHQGVGSDKFRDGISDQRAEVGSNFLED